jgi:hypothetical protein
MTEALQTGSACRNTLAIASPSSRGRRKAGMTTEKSMDTVDGHLGSCVLLTSDHFPKFVIRRGTLLHELRKVVALESL